MKQLLIKEINKALKKRFNYNFVFNSKLSQNIIFEREAEDKIEIVGITIHTHSHIKNESGLFLGFQDLIKGISFIKMNNLFESAGIEIIKKSWYVKIDSYNTNKILSINHPNWNRPFNKYPSISENLLDKNGELDEQKTEEVITILKDIIENQILPFYDLYPDLQSVNDTIIDVYDTTRELSDYISGMIGFKKMTIMGLCNNHKYNNYIEQYESKLVKGVEKDHEKYAPYLTFFRNLKKVLSENDDAPKVLE